MSTSKHRNPRKILSIQRFNTDFDGKLIPTTRIVYARVLSLTSRTLKTNLITTVTYVGSLKNKGIDAFHFQKPISVNLKSPMLSKSLIGLNFERDAKLTHADACKALIMNTPRLCKGLKGIVSWFDKSKGEGMVRANGSLYRVHACNILGAKTGYAETACMDLIEGSEVTFDLFDFGDHVSACKVQGGVFDAVKWASLDQSKLAFKMDENGQFINGLFA